MILLLLACTRPPAAPPVFVRDGVYRPGIGVEERAWKPGDTLDGVVAPRQPECVPLFSVDLEDTARSAVLGAPPPGAAMAFSPDGTTLAIGSVGGRLLLVDAWTGEVRRERRTHEGGVTRVAWSRDGGTLYVGEQSPDAMVSAMDPTTLEPRWQVRLADDLESSPLPPDTDVFGRYTLPAAFAILELEDGSLVVAGSHGWPGSDAVQHNRTRIWHLAADGTRIAAWPSDGAADAIVLFPSVEGGRILAGMSRSADGPAPPDLPVGGLFELGLPDLQLHWSRTLPPLLPYFKSVFLWEAVVAGPGFSFAGLGDGRALLLDSEGVIRHTLEPGVPVLSAGVPIAVGVGFATRIGDVVYFETTGTNIPWGSADPMARPPGAHPAQYSVHAVRADGTALWTRAYPQAIEGIVASPDGQSLMLAASNRSTDTRTDLFGAVLVDPADGAVVTNCATEGPLDFRPVWAPDNRRLAVAEAPFLVNAEVRGAYRVTVFR